MLSFRYHFIDGSNTRERLIEAIGDIDREADDFYIPRQAMQELLDGFQNLGTTRESIWTKLVKMFLRFMKFLFNIFVVLVHRPHCRLMENLGKQRGNTSRSDQNRVQGCQNIFSFLKPELPDRSFS